MLRTALLARRAGKHGVAAIRRCSAAPPSPAAVIIPARYGSTRFPGKPLAPILGQPMVVHTMLRAQQATSVQLVAVATDHGAILEAVEAAGGTAVLTPSDCATGTDRVWAALCEVRTHLARSFDIVINVQGDEALVDPSHIDLLVGHMRACPSDDMATLAAPIKTREDFDNPNTVKVVTSSRGYALYFSRAGIPHGTSGSPGGGWGLKHVGVYAFRSSFLEEFVRLPESKLQQTESLEQLKVLEAGHRIRVISVASAGPDVNVPSDIARVEGCLRDQGCGVGRV